MNYQNILNITSPQKYSTKIIMAAAKARNADLIVVSMADQNCGKKIAMKLINRAPCDILAIREDIL